VTKSLYSHHKKTLKATLSQKKIWQASGGVTPTEPLAKKIVNWQQNQKTKIALHRLSQIEKDTINENIKQIT
jgi:hypothetical protein